MRQFFAISLFVFFGAIYSLLGVRNDDPSVLRDPTGYKLRTGDVVTISVLGETECTISEKINSDERVRLVYIGELPLANMTTKQAETYIAQEYRRQLIFRDANVNVRITKYVQRYVFLSGALIRKGPFAFPPEVEAMNIVQVIARSGGFTEIANTKTVKVTRTFFDEAGNIKNSKTYEVNVGALSGGTVGDNDHKTFMIYPGDQIFVKERLV